MRRKSHEIAGYTFIGNIPNHTGLRPELLDIVKASHPTLYKMHSNAAYVREQLERHNYKFKGLRTIMRDDAYDLDGVRITPYGIYLAMYIHNDDMNEYNRRYESAMK